MKLRVQGLTVRNREKHEKNTEGCSSLRSIAYKQMLLISKSVTHTNQKSLSLGNIYQQTNLSFERKRKDTMERVNGNTYYRKVRIVVASDKKHTMLGLHIHTNAV